ncbi:MAG: GspE/PulE family protein [Pseudomonadales bacterium]
MDGSINQSSAKKLRIGDLLVQQQLITEQQLQDALRQQKVTGQKIGRTLIDLGLIEEDQLLRLLSRQLKIPFLELGDYSFNTGVTQRLPETHARRFRAIVLEDCGQYLLVGMSDPLNIFAYDELHRILKKPIKQAVVRETELLATLDIVYRRTDEISSFASELSDELGEDYVDISDMESNTAEEAPVVKMLQSIFEDAVQVKASDIHIEPDEKVLRIRQRVDGVLQEHVMNEKRIAGALVLRLKLMCGLDISEKRLPQDGRFNIKVKNRNIDVRLSSMPTQHGEAVVMRLLDQTEGVLGLDQSGMPAEMLQRLRLQIQRPHGLVLVTGPTGSGKTTTLYGALQELDSPAKKIITVEDPVEYRLARINQVQVHERIGLNFAKVLRACLRQDPDILLIGEIRDQETAEIALRASLTGHLVLSTLHTNDAISSALRLIDVGVEGYLVAGALQAVIAQRLIRKICDKCVTDYQANAQDLAWLHAVVGTEAERLQLKVGAGCHYCNNTGYQGRVGIFELLEVSKEMADALRVNDTQAFGALAKQQPGFTTLTDSALDYARQGVTSLDEVYRITEIVAE